MDLHKRTIQAEVKDETGRSVEKRKLPARREALRHWAGGLPRPFRATFEATIFSGWVYDEMVCHAEQVQVANPQLLAYISQGKKKSDKLDAGKLADLLRVNLIPECYMLPEEARLLRELLRYRHWLVRECTRFKNKITGQLLSFGLEYDSNKIHGKKYFQRLTAGLAADRRLVEVLQCSRGQLEVLHELERRVKKLLYTDAALAARVELLMSIPGVGEITALTWALEVWDPHRFANYRQAISFCGLCAAQRESGGHETRGPLSKKRNKHLQWVLVEASKVAVHRLQEPELRALYERTAAGSHKNTATIAVARELVKWLLAVDKRGSPFVARAAAEAPAAASGGQAAVSGG
jgi:transposase